MTIAYSGYGNPAPDSTDTTVQRPDFGTIVTYMTALDLPDTFCPYLYNLVTFVVTVFLKTLIVVTFYKTF